MASDAPTQKESQEGEETSGKADVLDLEASALSEALEELTRLPPEAAKTPRVKELLQSPDLPSRFMTLLSIVFGILAVVCFGLLITLYVRHRAHEKALLKAATSSVAVAPVPVDTISESLGEFHLFLSPEKPGRIELRVDVVAECSTQEACDYLKDHLPQSRDLALPVLSSATREEYLDSVSKRLIRKKIADRLNALPIGGKILQVDFTDMTIE